MQATILKNNLRAIVIFVSILWIFVVAGCESQPMKRTGGASRAYSGVGYSVASVPSMASVASVAPAPEPGDYDRVAGELIQKLLTSGRFIRGDGQRYVVACGVVQNETAQGIDTGRLMSGIRANLATSGQIVVTEAGGQSAAATKFLMLWDPVALDFKTNEQGALLESSPSVPELRLNGRVFQRTVRYARRGEAQVEYYLQIEIVNARSGVVFWMREASLGRRDNLVGS